jgi:hypothetical protein
MEVKGTAISAIPEFIVAKFGKEGLNQWLNSLTESARKVYGGSILAARWYPVTETMVEPTRKMCELFFRGDIKGAREGGRFSAEKGLKGVYRIFVKLGSPEFLIRKASVIFTNYYQPCEMKVVAQEDRKAVVHITKFPEPSALIENRIVGWMEKALEISGCKRVEVRITQSLAKGASHTEIVATWA